MQQVKQLGIFEEWRLNRKVALDLPRSNDTGNLTLAFIQKELDAFNEFCAKKWKKVEKALRSTYVEAERLDFQIRRLKQQLQRDPGLRYSGEEDLADWIVRQRRAVESIEVEAAAERLQVLITQIRSVENTTRLQCEECFHHTRGRISAYNGALASHLKTESLPPAPALPLSVPAEETYMKHHRLSTSFASRHTEEEAYYA
jgi:hypothetical protein